MSKASRYYIFGFVFSLVCLVGAELIWLPAPFHTGEGKQWIELIDPLFNVLALVPLSFAIGALLGSIQHRSERTISHTIQQRRDQLSGIIPQKADRVLAVNPIIRSTASNVVYSFLQLLRLIITVISVIGAGFIVLHPEKLVLILLFIGAGALLAALDMLVSEALTASVDREGKTAVGRIGQMKRRLFRFPKRSVIVLFLIAALLLALLCPTGYRVTYPGMTLDMNRYAHAAGGESNRTINGVLVFDRPAVPADWLYAALFPLYTFNKIPEDEPPLSESYTQVVTMKTNAEDVAAAVAMQKVGIGSGITGVGIRVLAVLEDSPAEQLLQAGDIIVKLDKQSVESVVEMIDYMGNAVKPGESLEVTLHRGDKTITTIVPTHASKDDPQRAVFGISVQTELKLDTPREVDFKHYMAHIGGPSHGAMLTLALIDQLTPGGVTKGLEVAGTGTIETDGSIGLVGGIPQKAYAISRTDADVFFVPAASEQAARSAAPDLNIVPVQTLDEVLNWLAEQPVEVE